MKHLVLFSGMAITASLAAQNDTLLFDNFESDPAVYQQIALPPGNSTDAFWYNFDIDNLGDGSGGNRPGEWFWSTGFAGVDSTDNVLMSNSWTNNGSTPVQNILVTPSLQIVDANANLSWESAPRQTPRFLDGYRVVVSTTTNDPSAFSDTIFSAAEFVSLDNQNAPFDFNSYTFFPAATANLLDPFVHGADGMNTVFDSASDSSRLIGTSRAFQVSLSQYSGMTIFIMFVHYTIDDNLLFIDDILVTGTNPTGMDEYYNQVSFGVYPNPAQDEVNLNINMTEPSDVNVSILDLTGKEVIAAPQQNLAEGMQRVAVNTSTLTPGMYLVKVTTATGTSTKRIIIQ